MNIDLLYEIVLLAIPVIVAITFHEAAHGYVALHFGDSTAKDEGRVTLNPLKHIDPFGTVILPAFLYFFGGFLFGYAKPVPVKFGQLRNPRWDMIWVAIAGPAMNITLAVVSAIIWKVAITQGLQDDTPFVQVLRASVQLNAILAVFNMLPLPPLDGSKVLAPFMPIALARPYLAFERFGMVILLLLVFVAPMLAERSGVNFDVMRPLVLEPARAVSCTILSAVGLESASDVASRYCAVVPADSAASTRPKPIA
jgi:Zn-dependent protease